MWLIITLTVVLTLFLIYKLIKNRKRNYRKEYFKILKNLNFDNTKDSAYKITKYSRLLAKSERQKRLAQELNDALNEYKYKRYVKDFDTEIKNLYDRFMDSLDV